MQQQQLCSSHCLPARAGSIASPGSGRRTGTGPGRSSGRR